ncbi:MAG: DUF1015 domain-containing protein [Gemmatimonadetes bacterium]|nr:DUF1015 domain-containing protein [Gemmatimonadota bacterium]
MTRNLPPLVTPLSAERYAALDQLSELIAPPYDVISPSERAELGARSPNNIVHVMLPGQDGDRYAVAAKRLNQWRRARVLVREPEPSLYVLRQEFSTPDGLHHLRTGVFVGLAAEGYETGRVRPHERTHAGPKADRLALLEATETMFESIFVLAPDRSGALQTWLARVVAGTPIARAELAGASLAMWRVSGAQADAIAAVAGSSRLYIADGHHRFETAVAYRARHAKADRTIALVVPLGDPGLVVLPTYRLIRDGRVGEDQLIASLASHFEIEGLESELNAVSLLAEHGRETTAALVILPAGRVMGLRLRREADLSSLGRGSAASLDVARVDALIVAPLVRLAGPGASVDYTPDPGAVFDEVSNGNAAAGVLLNPTKVSDVLKVADAGEVMPPKSTYFIPKVPSGLVLLPH